MLFVGICSKTKLWAFKRIFKCETISKTRSSRPFYFLISFKWNSKISAKIASHKWKFLKNEKFSFFHFGQHGHHKVVFIISSGQKAIFWILWGIFCPENFCKSPSERLVFLTLSFSNGRHIYTGIWKFEPKIWGICKIFEFHLNEIKK